MIHSKKLQQILLKKALNQSLGHFYIICPGRGHLAQEKLLKDWTLDLVGAYIHGHKTHQGQASDLGLEQKKLKEVGHPDVLIFGPEKLGQQEEASSKDYQVKELAPFTHFLGLRPFELPHRFVVMEGAHHITEIVGNKLLKSFEEPGNQVTVFLLHPFKTPLLSTIKGRALVLQLIPEVSFSPELPASESNSPLDFPQWLQQEPTTPFKRKFAELLVKKAHTQELLELFKESPLYEEEFVELCLDWQRKFPGPFLALNEFLLQLEDWEKSLTFHNSRATRLYSLFPFLPLG